MAEPADRPERQLAMTGARDAPAIDLRRRGPTEQEWRGTLDALPAVCMDAACGRRVVVVTPHPDDESLGIGGTVAMLAAQGAQLRFVSLTDGEAAPCPTDDLAAVRRAELARAACALAPGSTVVRCGLPDGQLSDSGAALRSVLTAELRPGDLVFTTLDGDGHPDHDAAGAAVRAVAADVGAELWWFAIWAWHWHDPTTSPLTAAGVRSELTPAAMAAKRRAIAGYGSQLSGAVPVVPAEHLPRFERPYEILVRA